MLPGPQTDFRAGALDGARARDLARSGPPAALSTPAQEMLVADAGGATTRNFKLNARQAEFVFSPYKFGLFIGGVGTGKTFTGNLRSIGAMTSLAGSVGAIAAPTYKMLDNVVLPMLWEMLPPGWIKKYNDNKKLLILKNDARVIFLSGDDPEKARGLNLAWFWMDEATICGHYMWQILTQRLRQRGYAGWGWATGTPRGRDGFWREFEGMTGKAQKWRHLVRSSTFDNLDNLPDGFIESLNFSGPFFDQEVMGLFTAFEGLVYFFLNDPGDPRTHVRAPDGWPTLGVSFTPGYVRRRFRSVIGGIDWGAVNPAVSLVLGLDNRDVAWQLDEFYLPKADRDLDHLPATVALTKKYGVQTWYCDPAEPDNIAALKRAISEAGLSCNVVAGENDILPGIQTMQAQLAWREDQETRGLYVHPRCTNTIIEFGVYQYPTKRNDLRNPSEVPVDKNNHAMAALRYALHTHFGQTRSARTYLNTLRRRVELQREETRLLALPQPVAARVAAEAEEPETTGTPETGTPGLRHVLSVEDFYTFR